MTTFTTDELAHRTHRHPGPNVNPGFGRRRHDIETT